MYAGNAKLPAFDQQAYASQIGGGVMTAIAADPGERPREVQAVMMRLDGRLADLANAVEMLDNRLTGYVARPNPPVAGEAKTAQLKGAMQTGLGSHLDQLADHVEAMTRRARDLYERLEA
jgi:hypothetical protein